MPRRKFEPGISGTQVRSVTACENSLGRMKINTEMIRITYIERQIQINVHIAKHKLNFSFIPHDL
jgi:hypothetical protein